MLVREFLACSEIGASRAVGSETMDTNILRSDANLSHQNLAVSWIGLNFVIENIACIVIAVDVMGLESLKVWVDVLVGGRAQGGWRSLNARNCLRNSSATFNDSANLFGLDHISIGESDIVLVAGRNDSQIGPKGLQNMSQGEPKSFPN